MKSALAVRGRDRFRSCVPRSRTRSAAAAAQPAGPPQTARQAAPIDLTGYWVSLIVDEWRFRVTPQKGDIVYLPLNAQARQIANAWDPDKDQADGNACKAYGAVGVMQRPGGCTSRGTAIRR